MCYSAQIERDWNKYVRIVGPDAALNLEDFIKKYWWRQNESPSMKIPYATVYSNSVQTFGASAYQEDQDQLTCSAWGTHTSDASAVHE